MILSNGDFMIKICFVCLGNICRSPMAEYVMKDKVKKLGRDKEFLIISRATSYEEEGNDMHYGTKDILDKMNISYSSHSAKRLEKDDYEKYDYFVCMDSSNIRNTLRIFGSDSENKVIMLLDKDVKDPWYTGNFIETYYDVDLGTDNLINKFK